MPSVREKLAPLEIDMSKSKVLTVGVTLAAVTLVTVSTSTWAATKKMSYEQAFAKCKTEITANVPYGEATSSAPRYTAGSACMHKYGFRLKKKSKF
jgi:hypothetical protein